MSHTCHALGCNAEVPPALFMCRRHWYMVPKPQRKVIWRLYRPGQEIDKSPSREYLVAAKEAIVAVAQREQLSGAQLDLEIDRLVGETGRCMS